MTAEIFNIRDYQNKKDMQRLYEEVTAELKTIEADLIAVEIANVTLIDTAPSEYCAPESDPA